MFGTDQQADLTGGFALGLVDRRHDLLVVQIL
jgi:hypothetical protein